MNNLKVITIDNLVKNGVKFICTFDKNTEQLNQFQGCLKELGFHLIRESSRAGYVPVRYSGFSYLSDSKFGECIFIALPRNYTSVYLQYFKKG